MKTLSAILIFGFCFTAQAQDKNALVPDDMPADAIFDEGTIAVAGTGSFARAEDFMILKRPDGGYSIVSNISADDGSYSATATWLYDNAWRAKSASGRSVANGVERKIDIRREGDTVVMQRRTTPKGAEMAFAEFTAPCADDCLIDMTPAILPMSIMARRFDAAKGGSQTFKWVGVSLIGDQVLTDGTATINLNRMVTVEGLGAIAHWRFVEDLKDPTGRPFQMNAHLWTDTKGHLRKFGMGRAPKPSTIGIRLVDEDLSAQMPPE